MESVVLATIATAYIRQLRFGFPQCCMHGLSLDMDGTNLGVGLDWIGPDERARPPEEWREECSLNDALDNPPVGQDTTLTDPSLRKC